MLSQPLYFEPEGWVHLKMNYIVVIIFIISPLHADGKSGEVLSSIKHSGASQQKSFAAFSLTTEAVGKQGLWVPFDCFGH